MIKFLPAFMLAAISVFLIFGLSDCNKYDNDTTVYNFEKNNANLSLVQLVGKKIFFDTNLSNPSGQSCASCHNATAAFTDPLHKAFPQGAVTGNFNKRNAPSIAYMAFSPARYYDVVDSTYIGGLFWDGRVNSFEEQAIQPLLNHIEMNNSDSLQIVDKIQKSDYALLFQNAFGADVFTDKNQALRKALHAVAEFERAPQVSPFTSKYDYYLVGQAALTAQEMRGFKLFNDTTAKCLNCHPSDADNNYGVALFTDFSYDNIGLPANPASPTAAPDLGLGGFLNNPSMYGQFKVPSLRNVELTAPYFHNGVFNTLEDAIRFYSERDVPGKYPLPEVNQNVNHEELGNLHLSEQDIQDISAFLRTLTDGYKK